MRLYITTFRYNTYTIIPVRICSRYHVAKEVSFQRCSFHEGRGRAGSLVINVLKSGEKYLQMCSKADPRWISCPRSAQFRKIRPCVAYLFSTPFVILSVSGRPRQLALLSTLLEEIVASSVCKRIAKWK